MAFSGDPTNVNVHSGGTGKSAYPIADQFVPEVWGQAILDVFQQTIMMDNLGVNLSTDVSQHGDVGTNGSRGSARGLARATYKMSIGHGHGARICQGVWQCHTPWHILAPCPCPILIL